MPVANAPEDAGMATSPKSPKWRILALIDKIKMQTEILRDKTVQVGKDQEKAQSEKDYHSKNRGGKKPN